MQVEFDLGLDMAPYMADRPAKPLMYELYGIIVHQGHSSVYGHYVAYVRAANGLWYCCNDSQVAQVWACCLPLHRRWASVPCSQQLQCRLSHYKHAARIVHASAC